MLRAVERVLSDDYQVVTTRLSRDALAVADEFRPELAIVDIRMPDMDGFELMARLKGRFPALDVILMTGSIDDLDEKLVRAIRSPAFYFIQKPFDRDVLRTLVERCVELRWRREDHRQNLKRLETEIAEARAFQQSLLPERERVLNRVSVSCRRRAASHDQRPITVNDSWLGVAPRPWTVAPPGRWMVFPITEAQIPCLGVGMGGCRCQVFDTGSYDSTSL